MKFGRLEIKESERRFAELLQREKMAIIRGNFVILNNECDLPYEKQLLENEKRYKTIVKSFHMDEDGNRKLVHKFILPFHQSVYEARKVFLSLFSVVESDRCYIEIEHTDTVRKIFNTVSYKRMV